PLPIYGIVEGGVGVIDKVAIGIALNDRQAACHAGVDAFTTDLDAAAVDVLGIGEKLQERAVAATHVEHARAGLHHLRDQEMVDAVRRRLAGGEHYDLPGATFSPRFVGGAF